jgi:hypothetical protein
LKLMWVPEHTEIENNESAKESLHEEPAQEIRATENDWFEWTKEAAKKKERNEWFSIRKENDRNKTKPKII